jgi:ATP-dependent Clp protease ATP-binding subunit ClpA
MYIVDVSAIGRQFPDKAIDLIDEACAATIKRVMRINKQAQKVNAKQVALQILSREQLLYQMMSHK